MTLLLLRPNGRLIRLGAWLSLKLAEKALSLQHLAAEVIQHVGAALLILL